MTPRTIRNKPMHMGGGNLELRPDFFHGQTSHCIKATGFAHIGCSEFCPSIALAAGKLLWMYSRIVAFTAGKPFRMRSGSVVVTSGISSFLRAISPVLCLGPKPKMNRVYAQWSITGMANAKSIGDHFAGMHYPTYSMRKKGAFPKINYPVSIPSFSALPHPAIVWSPFLHLLPKSGLVLLGKSRHFIRRLNHVHAWLSLERLGRLIRSLRSSFLSLPPAGGNR